MRNLPAAVSFSSSALLLQCLLLLIATAVVDAKLARNIAKEDLTETSLRIIGGAGVEVSFRHSLPTQSHMGQLCMFLLRCLARVWGFDMICAANPLWFVGLVDSGGSYRR